jgi:hypothetical protein
LSGVPVDEYGFPIWSGQGNSHAAGVFQFQPGTWAQVAKEHNLDFQNPTDQAQGAWYYAQQTYADKTGGSLDADLDAGKLATIQNALQAAWPSVVGNSAAPMGLAYNVANEIGADYDPSGGVNYQSTPAKSDKLLSLSNIEGFFQRFGLILLGVLIIGVALWKLLSDQGIIPPPEKLAKIAATAI